MLYCFRKRDKASIGSAAELGPDRFGSHVGAQHFRNHNAAVGLLIVLE